jgi:hypothetical protein
LKIIHKIKKNNKIIGKKMYRRKKNSKMNLNKRRAERKNLQKPTIKQLYVQPDKILVGRNYLL